MSTDTKLKIKYLKDQIFKNIQSSGSFGSWLGNLRRKLLTIFTIPFAIPLPGLASNLASNAINKL